MHKYILHWNTRLKKNNIFTRYNSREAVRLLEGIPEHHAESSWALALRGKCHFELSEYKEAVELFKVLREQDPFRLDMMEYYSTALWHLQVGLQQTCRFTVEVKHENYRQVSGSTIILLDNFWSTKKRKNMYKIILCFQF